MCEIDQSATPAKGGGIHLSMRCKKSGKPISVTNEYGMFCADKCDLQENKDAKKKFEAMVNNIMPGIFK